MAPVLLVVTYVKSQSLSNVMWKLRLAIFYCQEKKFMVEKTLKKTNKGLKMSAKKCQTPE